MSDAFPLSSFKWVFSDSMFVFLWFHRCPSFVIVQTSQVALTMGNLGEMALRWRRALRRVENRLEGSWGSDLTMYLNQSFWQELKNYLSMQKPPWPGNLDVNRHHSKPLHLIFFFGVGWKSTLPSATSGLGLKSPMAWLEEIPPTPPCVHRVCREGAEKKGRI